MKVKGMIIKMGVVGAMAFTLVFGGTSMMASAYTPPSTCTHYWTAEEYGGLRYEKSSTHKTNDGQTCKITYYTRYYNIVCRSCGTVVGTWDDGTITEHSICP